MYKEYCYLYKNVFTDGCNKTGFSLINAQTNLGIILESSKSDCFWGKEMDGQTDEGGSHLCGITMYIHWPLKKKIKNSKDKSTFFAEEKKKTKNKMLTKLKLQNVLPPFRALLFLYQFLLLSLVIIRKTWGVGPKRGS